MPDNVNWAVMESVAPNSNREEVLNLLLKKYPPKVAAALLGHMDVETGGTYDYRTKQIGGGDGYGLLQYSGSMGKAYQDYLKSTGAKDSASSQIEFSNALLNGYKPYEIGAGNRAKIKQSFEGGDIPGIVNELQNRFVRAGKPHIERRQASAQKWYEDILKRGQQ